MNSLEIYLKAQMKLSKGDPSATDILGIFLDAKVDIGTGELAPGYFAYSHTYSAFLLCVGPS